MTFYDPRVEPATVESLTAPAPPLRPPPAPLRGGPIAFLRFAARNRMLTPSYGVLLVRWLWLRLRWRGRLETDGLCFICPGVKFEIGPDAHSTGGLGNMALGVGIARKGGVTREEVLNARSADEVLAFARARRAGVR